MLAKKFPLGTVVLTRGADEALAQETEFLEDYEVCLTHLLNHYQSGNWGDMDEEDCQTNDNALERGDRLMGAYTLPKTNVRIWIITEWDRSVTTILLPEDY